MRNVTKDNITETFMAYFGEDTDPRTAFQPPGLQIGGDGQRAGLNLSARPFALTSGRVDFNHRNF